MTAVPRGLPSGTVTFLFTDIEGSTKLLHEPGPEAYAKAVAEHRRKVREAFALIANSNLAWVTGDLGDRDQEVRLEEDNLRLARELGNERMEAGTLATLGVLYAGILDYPARIERDEGRLAAAAAMFESGHSDRAPPRKSPGARRRPWQARFDTHALGKSRVGCQPRRQLGVSDRAGRRQRTLRVP